MAAMSALLRPTAVYEVLARVGHLAPEYGARSTEELAVILEELGDLTTEEVLARSNSGLDVRTGGIEIRGERQETDGDRQGSPLRTLEAQGRIVQVAVPTSLGAEVRWVASELAEEYASLRPGSSPEDASGPAVLRRYLRYCGRSRKRRSLSGMGSTCSGSMWL